MTLIYFESGASPILEKKVLMPVFVRYTRSCLVFIFLISQSMEYNILMNSSKVYLYTCIYILNIYIYISILIQISRNNK